MSEAAFALVLALLLLLSLTMIPGPLDMQVPLLVVPLPTTLATTCRWVEDTAGHYSDHMHSPLQVVGR